MAGAASQAGDADASMAPGFFWFQELINGPKWYYVYQELINGQKWYYVFSVTVTVHQFFWILF